MIYIRRSCPRCNVLIETVTLDDGRLARTVRDEPSATYCSACVGERIVEANRGEKR